MAQENNVSRRDVLKAAGAVTAVAGAPFIQKAMAASQQVQYGMIGTGSRGTYLLKHLKKIASGRCVALCDIRQEALDHGVQTIGSNPQTYKDYHELLARKDLDAVFVIMPLFVHFPLTRDALLAGRHVFCEKCLVFKPEEVHALRALAGEHPKQILQTGLQRRYSYFYQMVQEHGGQGHPGQRAPHPRAVASQHDQQAQRAVDHEAGRRLRTSDNWRIYRPFSGGLHGRADFAPGGYLPIGCSAPRPSS